VKLEIAGAWGKAVEGHRSPRRWRVDYDSRNSRKRVWSAPVLWRFGRELNEKWECVATKMPRLRRSGNRRRQRETNYLKVFLRSEKAVEDYRSPKRWRFGEDAISPARPHPFQGAKSDAENFSFTEMLSCVSVKT
jgi:hypothetical protein